MGKIPKICPYIPKICSSYVQVPDLACRLCAEIAPQSLALAEAFGLTDDMISAPIAMDWIKYNEYDNQGEALVGHTAELTQS